MPIEKISITELVSNSGCFDLQFRKDTRHERTGSPAYYRWKVQFVITLPKAEIKTLQEITKMLGYGNTTIAGKQARFSVQNIDEISDMVVPYFAKNLLSGEKKKDFDAWRKAVGIIHKNKGKKISSWEKSDLNSLLKIHEISAKYKGAIKSAKWIDVAKRFA